MLKRQPGRQKTRQVRCHFQPFLPHFTSLDFISYLHFASIAAFTSLPFLPSFHITGISFDSAHLVSLEHKSNMTMFDTALNIDTEAPHPALTDVSAHESVTSNLTHDDVRVCAHVHVCVSVTRT